MNKLQIHQECLMLTENNLSAIKMALHDAQDAANNETKSTAGDKHETGRAMAQLETEKLSTQLAEAIKLNQLLQQLNPKHKSEQISVGSLVVTNLGLFYVSVSLGKLKIDEQLIYAISPISPIGQLMLTKKEKDSFSLNGKMYVIEDIL